MGVNFTKEELYVIERDADIAAGVAGKNIHSLAEKFLAVNFLSTQDKGLEQLPKLLMNLIQEHHRSLDIYKGIRDKCEKARMTE